MENTERLAAVHAQALGYPEAYEELPWGHPAIKVKKKVFLFCSALGSASPTMSIKLTTSRERVLELRGVEPMGYGLGKHGWCSLSDLGVLPVDQLLDLVDESYRAIAPKTLVRGLGDARPAPRAAAAVEVVDDALPRVLVVGAGPRRRQRAVQALSEAGCPAAGATLDDAVDAAGELQPEALILDVGREAQLALARLGELSALCPDAKVFVAGVRASTAVPPGAPSSAEPPGDPGFVSQVVDALA